ncbi:MAG: beta galactosidase jelly roll domain-containing protein [Verrucomicrobia bacterium]|nr:beta galactosidase jelly roll domain-containing protein [Verrucomicrobiota bacterium]
MVQRFPPQPEPVDFEPCPKADALGLDATGNAWHKQCLMRAIQTIQPPLVLRLDGEWEFAYTAEPGSGDPPVLPPEFSATMPVPGYWDDHLPRLRASKFWKRARFNPDFRPIEFPMGENPPDASLPYLVGVGWYRQTFTLPPAKEPQTATLHVGGVMLEAWVWINGAFAGHHLGHSTPFEIRMDPLLRPRGQNEIIIAVANTRRDRIGCVIRGYAGYGGGIQRPVHLKITGRQQIKSIYVRGLDHHRKLLWQVSLGDETRAKLRYAVRDENRIILQGEIAGDQTTWKTSAAGLMPWSDHVPKLYQIEVSLVERGTILDRVTQPFGLRALERCGTELRLNGRPVFLRGATEHAYFPLTCTPPSDIAVYRSQIRVLKELGFNWLRFHTWTPSEEHLIAADELGMLVQIEPPCGFGEQEWKDILLHCRKHPSAVIYCCGNEELLDEAKIETLRAMAGLCRNLALDALFNPQEALRGIEYTWGGVSEDGDGFVAKPYPHNPRRLAKLREFSDVFGQYTWGQLSYTSHEGDRREIDRRLKPYQRPCLSHEVGIHGNYLNLDLEHRYEGTRIGTGLFAAARRNLQRAGLLRNAPLYYRNSCAWMRILRKHAIETARHCRLVAGYDFLGATDHHWHRCGYPCGILNEFYELKPGESAADVRRYNGESVLLLDHDNHRNYLAGAPFHAMLRASYFGKNEARQGTISWRVISGDGRILEQGGWKTRTVHPGEVRDLGLIRFRMPPAPTPTRLTLHVEWSDRQYRLDNEWHFWTFPRVTKIETPVAADPVLRKRFHEAGFGTRKIWSGQTTIRLVSALTDSILRFLKTGGRVLLLGDGNLPSLPTSFQMAVAGRVRGNLATVIRDHPLMNRFPHEGFCDWQFYSMLEGGRAIVFDDRSLPFDPILEVVSSFKIIVKQAALAEFKAGAGRLLICSLNLNPRDPGAMHLLESMTRYAASDRFEPQTGIAMETLGRIIRKRPTLEVDFRTDQALDANLRRQIPPP